MVLHRVGPSDHARDQRHHLHDGVPATALVDPDMLGDQLLQTGAFGELQDRRETRARHEVGIIKNRGGAMADSHPADALL